MVLHKHHKIRTILQIKNTCKSWYLRISSAKLLFREIAFDTTSVSTVETAQACLRLLGRGSKIPLHIFIAGSKGDMDRFTRLQEKITRLLKRLSGFSPNIAHCQVWDPSDRMCDLLKGRASTLEYLRIGVTEHSSLFNGPLPSLRSMVVITSNSKLWRASTLPALTNLNLSYAGRPTGTSLRVLIALLQDLPQLQVLHLDNFQRWNHGDKFLPRAGPVSVTLRALYFTNCDFPPVLQYLRTPKLQTFHVNATCPDHDVTPLPLFQDPALLSRVQTAPILGNHGLCGISITTRQEPTKRSIAIEIFGRGLLFSVHLVWLRWRQGDWERWVDSSWRNLLQRSRLSSKISLTVDFETSSLALYPALLSVPCVEVLAITQGSLCEILRYLTPTVFNPLSYRLPLPVLKVLDLTAYTSLTIQEGNQIRAYLQFRAEVNAPVKVTVRTPSWSGARGFPWTSFMIANGTETLTTLALRP